MPSTGVGSRARPTGYSSAADQRWRGHSGGLWWGVHSVHAYTVSLLWTALIQRVNVLCPCAHVSLFDVATHFWLKLMGRCVCCAQHYSRCDTCLQQCLLVEWPQCPAQGCCWWRVGHDQVPVHPVWGKGTWQGWVWLDHVTLGSTEWPLWCCSLCHWGLEVESSGQDQGRLIKAQTYSGVYIQYNVYNVYCNIYDVYKACVRAHNMPYGLVDRCIA